jgi:phosphate transport system permease protein
MSSVAPTHSLNSLADNTVSARLAKKTTRHVRERLIEGLLFLAASVSVVVTVGIVLILLTESYQFFKQVSLVDFLTDNQWTPLFDDAHYGIMVLLSGTLVSFLCGAGRRNTAGHDHSHLPVGVRAIHRAGGGQTLP